jgi:hypothetical protein
LTTRHIQGALIDVHSNSVPVPAPNHFRQEKAGAATYVENPTPTWPGATHALATVAKMTSTRPAQQWLCFFVHRSQGTRKAIQVVVDAGAVKKVRTRNSVQDGTGHHQLQM